MNRRSLPILFAAMVLTLCLLPSVALADAPGSRGPDPLVGQGGTSSGPASADWNNVQELPPPSRLGRNWPQAVGNGIPVSMTSRQSEGGDAGNGAIAWLGRTLNPGNWILDAGMGIFAGIVKMFGGIMQKAVQAFLGTENPNPLPSGCTNAATNFVFCTPASLTYAHPGVQTVWAVLRGVASGLVSILFTVRLGRMIVEGPRSLAAEGKALILTFLCAMTFIQTTGPICRLLVEFFNGLSNLLLSKASLALPAQDVGDLNLGSNILFLVLWVIILLLVMKSFSRIVQIIVLLAVAPLAGALLMDSSTSGRFRSWFEKLIELLLAQINLVIIFVVIAAILQPYQAQGAGDQFVGLLLSIVMMGMALSGKSVVGIAGAALGGGGGGGMLSFLRYQVAGNALRSLAGGRGGRTDGARTGHTTLGSGTSAHTLTGERTPTTTGDPSQSVAAQRSKDGGNAAALPIPTRRYAEAFRVSDGDALHSVGGARSSGTAVNTPGASQSTLDTRREQARVRAGMMRAQATGLRNNGDAAGARALERKAEWQDRFGRGRDSTRPSRFSHAERDTRRNVYRQALAEANSMHALERDGLAETLDRDGQRLPVVERDLALASASGADTTALYSEQQHITQRLATSRKRLAVLTPQSGEALPRATRTAAAALANERLPHTLRSAPYAMRFGEGASTGALARRVTSAPTQHARDELARTRAVTVRFAQQPPDERPALRATRQKLGRRKHAEATENAVRQVAPVTNEVNLLRPRVRSDTIARLRSRRQAEARAIPDTRHDQLRVADGLPHSGFDED